MNKKLMMLLSIVVVGNAFGADHLVNRIGHLLHNRDQARAERRKEEVKEQARTVGRAVYEANRQHAAEQAEQARRAAERAAKAKVDDQFKSKHEQINRDMQRFEEDGRKRCLAFDKRQYRAKAENMVINLRRELLGNEHEKAFHAALGEEYPEYAENRKALEARLSEAKKAACPIRAALRDAKESLSNGWAHVMSHKLPFGIGAAAVGAVAVTGVVLLYKYLNNPNRRANKALDAIKAHVDAMVTGKAKHDLNVVWTENTKALSHVNAKALKELKSTLREFSKNPLNAYPQVIAAIEKARATIGQVKNVFADSDEKVEAKKEEEAPKQEQPQQPARRRSTKRS